MATEGGTGWTESTSPRRQEWSEPFGRLEFGTFVPSGPILGSGGPSNVAVVVKSRLTPKWLALVNGTND